MSASSLTAIVSHCRPSMSGLHLAKKGREHRKMDLQRDFTVASPAEFVTRFGGNRVIEKVFPCASLLLSGWWVIAFHGGILKPCPSLLCPPGSDRWQPRAAQSCSPTLAGWERETLPMLPMHGGCLQQLCMAAQRPKSRPSLAPVPGIKAAVKEPPAPPAHTTDCCKVPVLARLPRFPHYLHPALAFLLPSLRDMCMAPHPSNKERFQPDAPCPCPPRSSSPTMASPL